MKTLLPGITMLLCCTFCLAQKHDYNWMAGYAGFVEYDTHLRDTALNAFIAQ